MRVPRVDRAVGTSLLLIIFASGCTGSGSPTGSGSDTATEPAVTDVAASSVPSAPPTLAGRLLFARFTEATHTFDGMFASAADGSGEVGVPMPWTEGGGRWSGSGELIAVPTQIDDGRVGTAILDAAGNVVRVLDIPDETFNLPCTVWSPDDARLACTAWDDADPTRGGLYTVRSSDGGDLVRLTTPPAGMSDWAGDWSSNDDIVFIRPTADAESGPLFLVDALGGEPTELSSTVADDSPRFSPDGSLVATSSGGVIEVIDASGSVVSTIAMSGSFAFGPAWSPDGEWLVFSSTRSGFMADLFVSRPDGSELYQVTRTSDNEIAVDWGPEPG
jgi:Tol biopolymer transport system component